MKIAVENAPHWIEWTDEERTEIVEETHRILADPAFKNSKRCQALFRFLVDRSMAGNHVGIKERTIGVEVFGRNPDYDTAVDPVVRITANEIRKRLAQWYQEPAHHQRVRVRLVAGTYLLNFEFVQHEPLRSVQDPRSEFEVPNPALFLETSPQSAPRTIGQSAALPIAESESPLDSITAPDAHGLPARFRMYWPWIAAAALVLAIAALLFVRHSGVAQSKSTVAWKPLLGLEQPLTLAIADAQPIVVPDGNTNWQVIADAIANRVAPTDPSTTEGASLTAPLADAEVSSSFASWLAMHGQRSILRGSSAVTLQDLRQGPVVLIGGFNPWSLILLSNLRYSIRVDRQTHAEWIQDAQNPSNRDWMIASNFQPKDVDYAVITRFIDRETGHWILAVGGLRPQGTQAAADLVTDNSYIEQLPSQIKATGNFQIVIKTNFINGGAGPPQILAVHTW